MYRLVEENRNIERRIVKNLYSPSPSPSRNRRLLLKLDETPNKSPPRLPYDEMQMDNQRRQQQQQQQERLYQSQQQRSKAAQAPYEPPPESPRTYRRLYTPDNNSLDSGSNHSTGSARELRRSRIEMDNSSSSTGSGGRRHRRLGSQDSMALASPANATTGSPAVALTPGTNPRRGRKSHPWQTDVKINRFSSNATGAITPATTGSSSSSSSGAGGGGGGRPPLAGSSRTQQSTLGWKQRMQERRAVFGNVAVPEQSFDDDDDGLLDDDDDDDDESRGEKLEEQIREEAVELLKSKGFHNFHGILEHQYDDDLESVGGSVKSAGRSPFLSPPATVGKQQQTIRLGEIQSLRQRILDEQDKCDSNDTLPNHSADEDEEELFDQQVQGLLRDSGITGSTTTTRPTAAAATATTSSTSDVPAPEDNEDAIKAWRVMKQLKVRLLDVFTDDHFIVEAMGRKGVGSPSDTRIVIDQNAFARHKLRDAVEKRVSLVFTGDHHIVCSGDVDMDQSSVIQESLSGDTGAYIRSQESNLSQEVLDEEEEENQLLSPEGTEEGYRSPPELRGRLSDSFFTFEAMMRARQQAAFDEDEAAESTIRNQRDMLPSMQSTAAAQREPDDDQSCYTEYTVDTTTIDTTAFQTGNRQSIVSTATTVDGYMYPDNSCGGLMDDSRKTIKANNSQAVSLSSKLEEECTTPVQAPKHDDDDYDDESYAEYTVHDDSPVQDDSPTSLMAPNPFRMPGQAELPVQTRRDEAATTTDDQSYMEFTVGEGDTHPAKASERDDQSYAEYTVQEPAIAHSPPTRLPRPRQNRSDDESYMELTVADQASNPSVLMSPPDLTSPHLTSLLSSRMFADMQLPPELQQQAQQRSVDGDHENYPTITIHPEDDEMTQLTFDHTMEETVSASQDHHNHAAQYLDSSTKKAKEAFRSSFNNGADVTSVVGSQHTEQTRDTTVSDDASSTQQDGASFKSCVSTESSQFVAELLRRDIWSPDVAVVQTALEKLGQEAMKGFHERSNIVRYGGLLAMLRTMEMKPDQPQIQIAAFAALEKMSMDASTQVAIGEVGGISAVANSMRGHSEDIAVQQAACKALACLTRHREGGSVLSQDPIPTEGVVEAVTSTMQKHPDDADIQAHAFGTLANLCLDNQARLRELKKSGGLAAMTMALQVPWTNQTDQHEAISTLSILLRSMTSLDKK